MRNNNADDLITRCLEHAGTQVHSLHNCVLGGFLGFSFMSFICGLLCTPTNPAPALMFFSFTEQRRWTSGSCKLPWCKCFSSSESCLALLYLLLLGAKREKRKKKKNYSHSQQPQGTNISERKHKSEVTCCTDTQTFIFQTSARQPGRVNNYQTKPWIFIHRFFVTLDNVGPKESVFYI